MFIRKSMFFLILTLSFFLFTGISQSATILVPTDQPTIQKGIDNANTGDTVVVVDDTYYETVVVNKNITLQSKSGFKNCIIDAKSQGDVITVTASKATVKGFTVQNSSLDHCGIRVEADYCTIQDNLVTENSAGICLYLANDNKITDNAVSNNTYGIRLFSSDNNIISRNTVFGHTLSGIKLEATPKDTVCVGNTIYDNELYDNKINAEDTGNNDWNVPQAAGPNIIGGPYIGGNSWSDYQYSDTDGDGFGATPYSIPLGNNVDNLPLVEPILPDLTVSDIRLENNRIAYTLKNTGTYEASTGHVSRLEIDGINIEEQTVTSTIPAQGQTDLFFDVTDWDCEPPDYEVTVSTDVNNTIREENETNNRLSETWVCDKTSPVITSGPTVSQISDSSVVISWETDENADSTALYGVKSYGTEYTETSLQLTQTHTLTLSNLFAGTTYRYIAESTDNYGNTVQSRAGFFTTRENPDGSNPQVNFFKPIKGDFPHTFELIAEDPSGIGKVEFYVDDTLVFTDYSKPYILDIDPNELDWQTADLAIEHGIIARVFDITGLMTESNFQYQPPFHCFPKIMDFRSPRDGYNIPIPDDTDTVPAGTEISIAVDAAQREWPPRRVYGIEIIQQDPVDKIEVWVEDERIMSEENTTMLDGLWDAGGLPLGEYTVTAKVYGQDCPTPLVEHHTLIVEPYRPDVKFTGRSLERRDGVFEVTLTFSNRFGQTSAFLHEITDTLTGFYVLPPESPSYTFESEYSIEDRTSRVNITFPGGRELAPHGTTEVSFHAVPVLYPGFTDYEMGPVSLDYTDPRGASYNLAGVGRRTPGFMTPDIREATRASDYLIVANPKGLQNGNSPAQMTGLLDSMAELAKEKNGVLGFFHGRSDMFSVYDANDPITTGNALGDYREEIIIGDNENDMIHIYSTVKHRFRFEQPLCEEDMLVSGNVWKFGGDTLDEIIVAKGCGSDSGDMIIYDYRSSDNTFNDIRSPEGTRYTYGDRIATGDIFEDIDFDCDFGDPCPSNEEIVLANHEDGRIYVYDYSDYYHWMEREDFPSVFEEGDGFALANITGDNRPEILVAHESDDTLYIYSPDGLLINSTSLPFDSPDNLVTGNVYGDDKEEIIVVDTDINFINHYYYNTHGIAVNYRWDNVIIDSRDAVLLGWFLPDAYERFAIARGRTRDNRISGIIETYDIGLSNYGNDPFSLDALLDEGGEWAEWMGEDWVNGGYLLIVGEIDTIPAFGNKKWTKEFWGIDIQTYKSDLTDYPYASTKGSENRPELSASRIIGNTAALLQIPIRTALRVKRGEAGYGFERNDSLLMSAYNRCLKDTCGDINFHGNAVSIQSRLEDLGFTTNHLHMPDYTITDPVTGEIDESATATAIQNDFFANCPDIDFLYLTGHGGARSFDAGEDVNVIHESHVRNNADFGNKNPAVLAFSCKTGRYAGYRSFAESFLEKRAGAYVGATSNAYTSQTDDLASFFPKWDPDESIARTMRQVKRDNDSNASSRHFNAIFHVFGDAKFGATDPPRRAGAIGRRFTSTPPSDITIEIPDYKIDIKDGLDHITIPDGYLLCTKDFPIVPYYKVYHEFPQEYVVQNVKIVSRYNRITESGLYLPVCKDIILSEKTAGEKTPDPPRSWPDMEMEWETYPSENGTTLAITVYPFRYDTQYKEAEFYKNFDLQVETVQSFITDGTLTLSEKRYESGDTVEAELELDCPATPENLIVETLVRNENDKPVGGTPLNTLKGAANTVSVSLQWDSAGMDPGTYLWESTVRESSGDVVFRKSSPFVLDGPKAEITQITANPTSFSKNEAVALQTEVKNTGNVPVSGELVLLVTMDDGTLLDEFRTPFNDLLPGAVFTLKENIDSVPASNWSCRFQSYALFDGRTSEKVTAVFRDYVKGDVKMDGKVDLADAVLSLQIIAGQDLEPDFNEQIDIGNNTRIGLEDLLFILEEVAKLRTP